MIELLLQQIAKQKLLVSNLYQGTDGIWRCFLRDKPNALSAVHRGQGKSMAEALTSAMPKPDFNDLLG